MPVWWACSTSRRKSTSSTLPIPNFEGRMEESELCAYGRSKEKWDDCKIVLPATVLNTEGLPLHGQKSSRGTARM